MADDTDFVALYDELGLDAACSMADFKHAYRRRVAQLHPDHPDGSSDLSRLQRLNRLYAAAQDFHRRHGRLPGAAAVGAGAGPRGGHDSRAPAPQGPAQQAEPALSGAGSRWRYVLLMVLLAAAVYGLLAGQPVATPESAEPYVTPRLPPAPANVQVLLALGMDEDQVRRVQGEPFNSHQMRWEYGPSWILFDCRKVVDWYSSPLHPLHVQGERPTESEKRASGMLRKC